MREAIEIRLKDMALAIGAPIAAVGGLKDKSYSEH
jgi:hypothetical protein